MAKDAQNIYRTTLFTPVGVAKFPDLLVPKRWDQTERKAFVDYENGSYSVKLVLPRSAVAGMEEIIQPLYDEWVAAQKQENAKTKNWPANDIFQAEVDEDGNETGNVILSAKMKAQFKNKKTNEVIKQKPVIVDAKNQKFLPSALWGGSRLALKVGLNPYAKNDAKTYGMSFRLRAVQVIELVGPGAEDTSGFGTHDDGYDASAYESDEDFGTPETSSEGAANETTASSEGDSGKSVDF